jgi:uncharacterized membrane protein
MKLMKIAIILIVLGFALLIISLTSLDKEGKVQTKSCFVGFIGPIPIGFGTDKQMLYIALTIGIVIAVLSYLFFLKKPF